MPFLRLVFSLVGLVTFQAAGNSTAGSPQTWSEFNIGPFFVDTQQSSEIGRKHLAELEQLRWTIGKWFETYDLVPVWPLRVILLNSAPNRPVQGFGLLHGYQVLAVGRDQPFPFPLVARSLIEANAGPIPAPVEDGIERLFENFEAQGSRITLGKPPREPNLNWARMQLLATKPLYAGRLPVFFSNLRNGTNLSTAERNAFGKEPQDIEQEAAALLASRSWEPVQISGRPLDARRDFGEHKFSGVLAQLYLGDLKLGDRKVAIAEAQNAGRGMAAFAFESQYLDSRQRSDLISAMEAGSRDPFIYVEAAKGTEGPEAMQLLRRAEQLNPRWAVPVYEQGIASSDATEKERLLQRAASLDKRSAEYLVALAKTQESNHHAVAAQGSWLRAEAAAATDSEREEIRKQRQSQQDSRLTAEERDRRQKEQAARAALEQVRNDQDDRIRQAELRANERLAKQGGGEAPRQVVPWWEKGEEDKSRQIAVIGMLEKVECFGEQARLSVRPEGDLSQGTALLVTVDGISRWKRLSCDPRTQRPRKIELEYLPMKKAPLATAGQVTRLHVE